MAFYRRRPTFRRRRSYGGFRRAPYGGMRRRRYGSRYSAPRRRTYTSRRVRFGGRRW